MRATRRIERMVKEGDLPVASRAVELFFEPGQLSLIHVIAVERKKADAGSRLDREVLLASHVEEFVGSLVRVIMIAERRIELHALSEQGLVWLFELLLV